MFLAGKKSIVLKSELSQNLVCPKCNSKNTTNISIIGIYKHLVQIPFLNGGKTGASKCAKCNQQFILKNMPALVKLAYFELKETTKTPIWFYSGLIVIKTLVLIKIFSKYF
jgi:DNA-directed RNA polymerase subunit RPC12/RpoP